MDLLGMGRLNWFKHRRWTLLWEHSFAWSLMLLPPFGVFNAWTCNTARLIMPSCKCKSGWNWLSVFPKLASSIDLPCCFALARMKTAEALADRWGYCISSSSVKFDGIKELSFLTLAWNGSSHLLFLDHCILIKRERLKLLCLWYCTICYQKEILDIDYHAIIKFKSAGAPVSYPEQLGSFLHPCDMRSNSLAPCHAA